MFWRDFTRLSPTSSCARVASEHGALAERGDVEEGEEVTGDEIVEINVDVLEDAAREFDIDDNGPAVSAEQWMDGEVALVKGVNDSTVDDKVDVVNKFSD